MTDLRKAAEMALLTLEGWNNHGEWVWPESALFQSKRNTVESIEALRQALAQPEQVSIEPPDYVEPITFDYHEGWEEGFKAGVGSAKNKKESTPSNADSLLHGGDGNYIKQAQPEQEPVAWAVGRKVATCDEVFAEIWRRGGEEVTPLYTAPPRKEWVGLTEDDMHTIRGDAFNKNVDDMNWAVAMARKIDFILRKRNT